MLEEPITGVLGWGKNEDFLKEVLSKLRAKDEQDQPGEEWENGPGRGKSMCDDSEAKALLWMLYTEVLRDH